MTLVSVREQFIKFSGRYDLVIDTTDWADNGADFFIKAGQRWLDRTVHIGKSEGRYYYTIAANSWYVLVPNCRAMHRVFASNSDGEKWELEKQLLKDLRIEYYKDPALLDAGAVLYYARTSLRVEPEQSLITFIDQYGSTEYSVSDDHYGYSGLLLFPATDEQINVEIQGLFHHPILSEDDSQNFWSEEESFILVLAACRALEISYRNTQGVKDWEEAIKSETLGLEFDYADEESQGFTQIDG
jgi:hypothetical protein